MFNRVSIIVPVHGNETQLDTLLGDLTPVNEEAEFILQFEGTRAESLNAGAAKSTREFLWFLHADTRVTAHNLKALEQALGGNPGCLHYFDLAFDKTGLPALNAWGANMRSRLFGTPFGDQGFCIAKALFCTTGGFPEDAPYGEDLTFVWRARRAGIMLNRIPSTLVTSARKYSAHGWLKITLRHLWRWISLSVPEAVKLMWAG